MSKVLQSEGKHHRQVCFMYPDKEGELKPGPVTVPRLSKHKVQVESPVLTPTDQSWG